MSPVVLPPQVAIGAMGKIQRLPRFVGDSMDVEEVTRVVYESFRELLGDAKEKEQLEDPESPSQQPE